MSFYSRLLGHPFVYEHLRPLVVGGIDASPVFRKLQVSDGDIVLDIGCGTGHALNHLATFDRYHGVDPDPVAVHYAQARFGGRPDITFQVGTLEPADLQALAPTRAVLAGVLHHLADDDATALLSMLCSAPSLARVVTLDVVFLPDQRWSNLLAMLDRGQFCRRREGYEQLARGAGFKVEESTVIRSHPAHGRALYLVMVLVK